MRRTRLALISLGLLLLVCGLYAAAWFVAAGQAESSIAGWAAEQRRHGVDLSWKSVEVSGFPLTFRVQLHDARLQDRKHLPNGELRASTVYASARPWSPRLWRIIVPTGLVATDPGTTVGAKTANGTVTMEGDGTASIWFLLHDLSVEGTPLTAKEAELWVNLPASAPGDHTEPSTAFGLDVHDLAVPAAPAPFHNPIDEVSFGATLMGAIPDGPIAKAAAAWRDDGGTIELKHFALRWGALSINGSGTLALDSELQPIGGFSGAVEGYEQLMTALVASGRMHPGDARLARLALAMLAKAGPDGRPEIAASFTIQNGEMFLGPVKLGKTPRIAWQ